MAASVDGDVLAFRMPDPDRRLLGVRLQQDVRLPGDRLEFVRSQDDWVLTVPRPDVDRMEYAFELRHAGGGSEWVTDPGNPERVRGAFGDKSVLLMPGYAAPPCSRRSTATRPTAHRRRTAGRSRWGWCPG